MITFRQVRQAYNAIRLIDGFDSKIEGAPRGLHAFDNNISARLASLNLQKGLKDAVELSSHKLDEVRDKYAEHSEELIGDGSGFKFASPEDQLSFLKEQRAVLDAEAPGIDVEKLALRSSMFEDEIKKKISSDLLMDLGPFLILSEPQTNGSRKRNK